MKKRIIIFAMSILLLAILALTIKFHSKNSVSEMKIQYIALNIGFVTRIQIAEDEDYLDKLEKETGMSRGKIKRLFKYLLKSKTFDNIYQNAVNEITYSLREFKKLPVEKKIDFYVINILAPYLTLAVNNLSMNGIDENEIQAIFAELFNIPENETNPLIELIEGTYRYNHGGTSNLSYKYELNNYLKGKGFFLDYDLQKSYANILKIESVICANEEWKRGEKISIFILKRAYPNVLKSYLGYAFAWNSDVVVVKDVLHDVAQDYKKELEEKNYLRPYKDYGYQALWKSLNLNMDLEKANKILYELAYKDLNGVSVYEIEKNFIIQTAIHEAKHRIDEIEMPSMRLNLDLEISALLTEAILGVYPFLSLRAIIVWTEAYYRSTKYTQLKYLLAELWLLAASVLKEDYSENLLRAQLLKIYENYFTIQEEVNFIDLKEFEQRMLPIIVTAPYVSEVNKNSR